jgi:hypothetical protein
LRFPALDAVVQLAAHRGRARLSELIAPSLPPPTLLSPALRVDPAEVMRARAFDPIERPAQLITDSSGEEIVRTGQETVERRVRIAP